MKLIVTRPKLHFLKARQKWSRGDDNYNLYWRYENDPRLPSGPLYFFVGTIRPPRREDPYYSIYVTFEPIPSVTNVEKYAHREEATARLFELACRRVMTLSDALRDGSLWDGESFSNLWAHYGRLQQIEFTSGTPNH